MTTKYFESKISINPNVRFGKPCIKGTRIAVADILSMLGAGYSIAEIPKEYPGITKKDVIAAIEFAMQLSGEPVKVLVH